MMGRRSRELSRLSASSSADGQSSAPSETSPRAFRCGWPAPLNGDRIASSRLPRTGQTTSQVDTDLPAEAFRSGSGPCRPSRRSDTRATRRQHNLLHDSGSDATTARLVRPGREVGYRADRYGRDRLELVGYSCTVCAAPAEVHALFIRSHGHVRGMRAAHRRPELHRSQLPSPPARSRSAASLSLRQPSPRAALGEARTSLTIRAEPTAICSGGPE